MAYTPDYTESDLSASIVDIIVKGILVFGTFITIIILLFVWKTVKKQVR